MAIFQTRSSRLIQLGFISITTMATNRYIQLKDAGHLLEVEMDTVKILLPGGPIAIGTKNLNSCSGLVVLGEQAIILAHIAPLPPHPLGASSQRPVVPGEGEAHFKNMLNKVHGLYNIHKSRFPAQTTSWAIFGRFEAKIAMPEKLEMAKHYFASLGLPMKCAQYDIAKASDRTNPAAGTVIGVLQNRKAYLYVEDQLQDSIDFNQKARATSSMPSVQSQPTSTIASGSTGQTSTRPIVQTQGFWAFSTQLQQFSYRTRDNKPVPWSQWPQLTGRHQVMIAETSKIMGFDFDSKQWFDSGSGR